MGYVSKGTQHHCPGESKPVDGYPGNCRYTGGYCATHQALCPEHPAFAYMRSKSCILCEKAARIAASKKKDGPGDGNGGGAGGGNNGTSAKKRRKNSGGRDKGKFGKRPGVGKHSKSGGTTT